MQARQRTKVVPQKLSGRIAEWKGKFGWIQPDAPINHPEARLHKGQVYLSQLDVEAEIQGIGSRVSFFVYSDGTGLGAMNCRPAGVPVQPTVRKPQQAAWSAPQAKPAAAQAFSSATSRQAQTSPAGPKERVSNTKIRGQVKAWKGSFGWIVPAEPVNHPLFRGQIYVHSTDVVSQQPLEQGMHVTFFLYADSQGLGAQQCTIVDENGHPALPHTAAPSAAPSTVTKKVFDLGKRERLTVVPTTGEVSDWRGSFGFIKPHEAVDHPSAAKRQGKVYVSKTDLVGCTELSLGQLVQFHVFADNSGLGADECMPF